MNRYCYLGIFYLGSFGICCTEPIDITEYANFEESLVIEASITNEFKKHKIYLSKSVNFLDSLPQGVSNATVSIQSSKGDVFKFNETSPGIYTANLAFSSEHATDYQLQITSDKGKKYRSLKASSTAAIPIDSVSISRETNSIGNDIISISVDSFDPDRKSNYYRYTYEESYKIIAPYWQASDIITIVNDPLTQRFEYEVKPRKQEERVCYNRVESNSVIQTSTTGLSEDRVSKFTVRTISSLNPIISYRYSILIRQHVQSFEAYSYYNTLANMSGSDNTFSQIQPGFIAGNIYAEDDRNEKVIGYFEVTSVSEKRIFFNYTDYFPVEPLPPYFVHCTPLFAPPLVACDGYCSPLLDAVDAGEVKYYTFSQPGQEDFGITGLGPEVVVRRECGDCTALGSNVKPDFWIE